MPDPRAGTPSTQPVGSTPVRVLVADDDAASLRLLARVLEASGFAVETAHDGREAIERVVAQPPQIVLLDFEMPGLNGLEVCAALRHHVQAALRDIPVIMLTAHDGEAEEVACLHAGANDFVAKPMSRVSLVARIETQLRLRALNAELRAQNDELARWRSAHVADLEAAQRVQRAILPAIDALPGWRIAAHYEPMIQVGGDVYGVEPCADGAVIWLADATGHGVAAALCTTLVAILFERAAARTADPADVLTHVNTDLFAIFRGSLVMSAICAHFAEDGTVRVAGAGHPPLLVQHRDGRIESIASRGTLLGVGEKFRGAAEVVRLAGGDRALLFSDGLFGARRSNGERQQHTDIAPAWAGCAGLEALAERMRGDSAFDDDVSAILVARLNTTVVSDDTFSRHSYAPPE